MKLVCSLAPLGYDIKKEKTISALASKKRLNKKKITLFVLNYLKIIWVGNFFYLTSFKRLGQKSVKKFVGILVYTMTPKGHFKINWILCIHIECVCRKAISTLPSHRELYWAVNLEINEPILLKRKLKCSFRRDIIEFCVHFLPSPFFLKNIDVVFNINDPNRQVFIAVVYILVPLQSVETRRVSCKFSSRTSIGKLSNHLQIQSEFLNGQIIC
jgi:hypothetical protein